MSLVDQGDLYSFNDLPDHSGVVVDLTNYILVSCYKSFVDSNSSRDTIFTS